MKIFIVSKYGSSKDLALKLLGEGNDVLMYITNRNARRLHPQPFVVSSPSSDMLNVDLFWIEDDTAGAFADKARQLGRPTLGGGSFCDKLARNPVFLRQTIEGCGLKPANEETKGINMHLGGWFSGEEFVRPYFFGLHYTRVGAGDVGKKTAGMGVAGQYKMRGKFFSILKQLEMVLKTAKYTGFVDLVIYVNEESIKVVDIHLGLGFPVTAVLTNIHGTMSSFLFKIATGIAKQVAVQPDKVGVGVVWLPNLEDAPICPTLICGVGGDIKEATDATYKSIHKLNNADAYYRVDIGLDYDKKLSQLRRWDWI